MKSKRTVLLALCLAATTGLAAAHGNTGHADKGTPPKAEQKPWGVAGQAKSVTRTITVAMSDAMRFAPDTIAVKLGETIRFVVRNDGKVMHEFVIGTKKELDEHAALMVKFPNMEHDEPYMAHVAPGRTGTIVWTFNRPGTFDFACLIAGHYQAGMVGTITVAAK